MERAASAASLADWDTDGDLDLLIGNIRGEVFWSRNDGNRTQFRFQPREPLQTGGKPLALATGDAHPVGVDWDADGTLDLLVAGSGGGVMFYRGYRSSGSGPPSLESGERLIAGSKPIAFGHRVKLCVCDWNGDKRLDLIAGTNVSQRGREGDIGHVWVMLRE